MEEPAWRGSPDLAEVMGHGVWRSSDTGWVGPQMGGGCEEIEYLPRAHHDFLLLFFFFLCAAAGVMSCFAQAVGQATR